MFAPVTKVSNFAEIEERLIAYWKKNKIFEKSISSRSPKKKWTFLDGPPFITGMPHYGTLLSSIPKDVFGRYWTMKGYRVRRVWGWDCHGLPAENKVENKLGLKRKKDIEEVVGVKKFIEECKLYVSEVSSEWEWYIDHIARWVDFKNAYRTMDASYMESVMWVFKTMYDKGHIYKGLRVSLYCPHCSTPISNFEVAMDADNHKDMEDLSATYKYKLKGEKSIRQAQDNWDTFLLAWSTTPWNKIVTPALAVNPKLSYVKVKQGSEYYILAKNTLKMLKGKYEIVGKMKGSELVGKAFELHYDFYKVDEGKKVGVVIPGDFVTEVEGTGIVTMAVYGEEDLIAMQANDIQLVMHLDDEGMIKQDVPKFGGMYYLKANKAVNEDLKKRGLLYDDTPMTHTVPLCWRCHTRLYYAPQDAWYVDIQKMKKKLAKTNEAVNWYPKHFKEGRFLKSMESAPDWCISRSRYWGSPVPVWECACGERFVPGSIVELEEASALRDAQGKAKKITDLHKPEIDEITIICSRCGKTVRRVPEVLDSWIEAGSASFAERHFPFDTTINLEDFFPPDFIVEYTGQIRAWFYVLHVIATALYDSNAFKNVLVTGVILGTDGRKMSKNFGNYPDPKEMLQKYGGDALRLYLLGSPVMNGEDIAISEEQYRNQVRGMLLILWNVYNFFVMNANADGWEVKSKTQLSKNILDEWILSLLQNLAQDVTNALEKYDTVAAVVPVQKFIDEFSTWYIRRSRDRVGPTAENKEDKQAFYSTCYEVLTTLCKLIAPLTPFISDEMYTNLTKEESVHLSDWPNSNKKLVNNDLEKQMFLARKLVEIGHSIRKENSLKVRQPLASITYKASEKLSVELETLLLEELNIKKALFSKGKELAVSIDMVLTDALQQEGEARSIVRQIQEERKKLGTTLAEKVRVTLPFWPEAYEDYIKKKALVYSLQKGDRFYVEKV